MEGKEGSGAIVGSGARVGMAETCTGWMAFPFSALMICLT